MTVVVRLFARAREVAGTDSMAVDVADGASVANIRAALVARIPAAAELIARSAVGVNGEYADDEHVVGPADEIALIPPVSGG